jgi:hypothetical protein
MRRPVTVPIRMRTQMFLRARPATDNELGQLDGLSRRIDRVCSPEHDHAPARFGDVVDAVDLERDAVSERAVQLRAGIGTNTIAPLWNA